MFIAPTSIASLIREGDYFIIVTGAKGHETQYTPLAAPGAPTTGSFAACGGRVLYRDAEATAVTLAKCNGDVAAYERLFSREAEVHCQESRTTSFRKSSPLAVRLSNALVNYAGASAAPEWEGPLGELLFDLGFKDTQNNRKAALVAFKERFPHALEVTEEGRRGRYGHTCVKIDLAAVAYAGEVEHAKI